MSATITILPGVAGQSAEHAEECTRMDYPPGAPSDPERVARLIELYRRLGTAPVQALEAEAISSVLLALDEGREQDALDLLDIALEEPEAHVGESDFAPDDEYGTPIPHAAMIWRRQPRPVLSLVGGTAADTAVQAGGRKLVSRRAMALDALADWIVDIGDLQVDSRSRQATIELGAKGELFVLLRSGALTIETNEGLPVTEIASSPAGARLVRIIYYGARSRSETSPIVLRFEASGTEPIDGVWCHSSRKAVDETSRPTDQDRSDGFVCEHFLPIGPPTPAAFCGGAEARSSRDDYRHKVSVKHGDFARFTLGAEPLSAHGPARLEAPNLSTTVTGMMAAPAPGPGAASRRRAGGARRKLVEHPGEIEVFLVVDGVTWVAVAPEKARGAGDDPEDLRLAPARTADGSHTAAFVTPLVSTVDGGCDVMLLRPAYGHSVWMTPGSQSRFIHLSFDDPAKIVPARKSAHGKPPNAQAATRAARGV